MSVKRLIILSLVAVMLIALAPSFAQDGGAIEYNSTITGEITNDNFEVNYSFSGAAGDVVLARVEPVEFFGGYADPVLTLTAADGTVLAYRTGFSSADVAAILPVDGDYTLTVGRADGASGSSVGEFYLSLWLPDVLTSGASVSASTDSDSVVYYVVKDLSAFTLAYEKSGGEFAPEISVNAIVTEPNYADEFGYLETWAALNGKVLKAGSLSVDGDADVYVIKVAEALFDFNFFLVTADYTLTLD